MADDIVKPASSLLSKESYGGESAQAGIRFQVNVALSRLPGWLAQDGFGTMIQEALGDTEAKFFVPGVGDVVELVEAKNHCVTPSEFWREIKRFQELDGNDPRIFQRFVLACTGISDKLAPVVNGLSRVRSPGDFYAKDTSVMTQSVDDFVDRVIAVEGTSEIAHFLMKKVFVEPNWAAADEHGQGVFQESVCAHLPALAGLSIAQTQSLYSELRVLLGNRINAQLTRIEIEDMIAKVIGRLDLPLFKPILLYTASSESQTGAAGALCLEWSEFSGGHDRTYPSPDEWDQRVVKELRDTKEWILRSRSSRRIRLLGSRRLSASVAIGAVFSAVSGFAIDTEYRGVYWATDEHADPSTPEYDTEVETTDGTDRQLVACVGILHRIGDDVRVGLRSLGLSDCPVLDVHGEHAIVSARQANLIVARLKTEITKAVRRNKSERVHLFIAAPAPLALFLGHRLNAVPPVQCYEYVASGVYVPTCRIPAN